MPALLTSLCTSVNCEKNSSSARKLFELRTLAAYRSSLPLPQVAFTSQKTLPNLRSPHFLLHCPHSDPDEIHASYPESHVSDNNGNIGSSVSVYINPVQGEAREVENGCYYQPHKGEFVVGIIVSVHEHMLHIEIGAELTGILLKETVFWQNKVMSDLGMPENSTMEVGTILFCEVTGRTISGRALLSVRSLARKIAWHRVTQMKHLDEPIVISIEGWNATGLISRIEGLRAFLPKSKLMDVFVNVSKLKEKVGRQMNVKIIDADEVHGTLIISEREAWGHIHIQAGALLDGTVEGTFKWGAQIRIKEAKIMGLLHISNVSQYPISSIYNVLCIGDKVRVMVLKSTTRHLIHLSIADLESEPGLFLSDRERVFSEAERMAEQYKQKLRDTSITPSGQSSFDLSPFNSEENMFSNLKWFRFEREIESLHNKVSGS